MNRFVDALAAIAWSLLLGIGATIVLLCFGALLRGGRLATPHVERQLTPPAHPTRVEVDESDPSRIVVWAHGDGWSGRCEMRAPGSKLASECVTVRGSSN